MRTFKNGVMETPMLSFDKNKVVLGNMFKKIRKLNEKNGDIYENGA